MIVDRFQRENPFRMRILGSGVVFLAALIACLLALAPPRLGLVLFGIVVWFACPGAVLGAWRIRQTPGRALAVALNASIWGYGLSSVALLLFWCAGLRGGALLAAPVIAGAVAWLIGLTLRDTLTAPAFNDADIVAVLLLLVVTLGDHRAALRQGRLAGRGWPCVPRLLHRRLRLADGRGRGTEQRRLSRRKIPFYRRDQLRYYWLAHLLPAAEYQALAPHEPRSNRSCSSTLQG